MWVSNLLMPLQLMENRMEKNMESEGKFDLHRNFELIAYNMSVDDFQYNFGTSPKPWTLNLNMALALLVPF